MSLLDLTDEHARLGKIANNLEIHGKEKSTVTGFTLPLKLRVPRPMLVVLMGEEFDRCVWVFGATNEISGCASWARRLLPMSLDGETYIGVKSAIVVGGNLEPEHAQELTFEGCRVSKIEIVALAAGGITEIDCQLYVHPGISQTNLLLQEYQEREVAVQMTMGKLRVKADKAQQDLPLNEPSAAPAVAESQPLSEPKDTDDAQERGTAVEVVETELAPQLSPESIKAAREILAREVVPEQPFTMIDGEEVVHIGTPEQEREKAHEREREIARLLTAGRKHRESA